MRPALSPVAYTTSAPNQIGIEDSTNRTVVCPRDSQWSRPSQSTSPPNTGNSLTLSRKSFVVILRSYHQLVITNSLREPRLAELAAIMLIRVATRIMNDFSYSLRIDGVSAFVVIMCTLSLLALQRHSINRT